MTDIKKFNELRQDIFVELASYGKIVKDNRNDCETLEYINLRYNFDFPVIDDEYCKEVFKSIKDQFNIVMQILKDDKNTRQSLLTFWNSNTLITTKHDELPCYIVAHFLIRDNKLTTIIYQRSQDIIKKLHRDCALFWYLSKIISKELKVDIDNIKVTVGSAHIYV